MDKLFSLDFAAKLAFAVPGAAVNIKNRAQPTFDSSNDSNNNDPLPFVGASRLLRIKG